MFENLDFYIGNLFSFILFINTIFGAIINFWFIITFLKNKILRSSKYIGIINLSLVDLFLCLFLSPLQILRETISINENVSLNPFLCCLITFLSSWASLASIFSLTLISLERLLVFKRNRHLKREKFIFFVALAHFISFMFAFVNSIMNWLGNSVIFIRCSNKREQIRDSIKFSYVSIFHVGFKVLYVIVGLICLWVTTYCYIVIYRIIRNKQLLRLKLNGLITLSKEINQDNSTQNLTRTRRLSKSSNSIEKSSNFQINKKVSISLGQLNINKLNFEKENENFYAKINVQKSSVLNLDKMENDEASLHKVTIVSLNESVKQNETKLKTKNIKFKNTGSGSMESKAIRKTLIPIIVFYLFWLPYALVQLCTVFSDSHFFELANLISISIGFCHSSINPIVYCCTNVEIRKAMKTRLKNFLSSNLYLKNLIERFY